MRCKACRGTGTSRPALYPEIRDCSQCGGSGHEHCCDGAGGPDDVENTGGQMRRTSLDKVAPSRRSVSGLKRAWPRPCATAQHERQEDQIADKCAAAVAAVAFTTVHKLRSDHSGQSQQNTPKTALVYMLHDRNFSVRQIVRHVGLAGREVQDTLSRTKRWPTADQIRRRAEDEVLQS